MQLMTIYLTYDFDYFFQGSDDIDMEVKSLNIKQIQKNEYYYQIVIK